MNCSILVKNILIQVVPHTVSIFVIDAFDTLLNIKILSNRRNKEILQKGCGNHERSNKGKYLLLPSFSNNETHIVIAKK